MNSKIKVLVESFFDDFDDLEIEDPIQINDKTGLNPPSKGTFGDF